MERWERFFESWQKDLILWFFCMAFFLLYRLAFIVLFRAQMEPESTWLTAACAILNGMRFDSKVSTTFALIPFTFSCACLFADVRRTAHRVRMATGEIFLVLAAAVCAISIEYFREFNDQFNHYLLGIVFDDRRAILGTIFKSYHALFHLAAFGCVVAAGSFLLQRILRRPLVSDTTARHIAKRPLTRALGTLAIGILMLTGIRGSIGAMPARERHAGITPDDFLNKTVINPFTALRYTVMRHIRLTGTAGVQTYLPDGDVAGAVKRLFGRTDPVTDLDTAMLRIAKGPKGLPPRHIFIIIAESYSAWPMQDIFAPLHVSDGLKSLAGDGIAVSPFIASAQGTMASINTIVTGLPDAEIQTNYRQSSRYPFPTSITTVFEGLGYRTRFFYGGYLTWQRLGDFLKDQGFDEVHGGSEMGSWISANEWGVDDEHIFSYVEQHVDNASPSINIVLTTSFHPPYTVDVVAKGFSVKSLPQSIAGRNLTKDDAIFLGHLWYADRCIERFARKAVSLWPASLVVVTADHPGRRWLTDHPSPTERYLIPCVFFGPEVLAGLRLHGPVAGCHLDLVTTLVELAAPKGYVYHSLGKDLLDSKDTRFAVGRNLALSPNALAILNPSQRLIPLGPSRPDAEESQLLWEMADYHNAVHGIAWWRVMRGNTLPVSSLKSKTVP